MCTVCKRNGYDGHVWCARCGGAGHRWCDQPKDGKPGAQWTKNGGKKKG